MTIREIPHDAERGWEPLMQWARDQGFDPHIVKAMSVDTDTMTVTVEEYDDIRDGRRRSNHVTTRTTSITKLPPQRPGVPYA